MSAATTITARDRESNTPADQPDATGSSRPTTCRHCGLPLPARSTSPFCCSGCHAVYEAIKSAGLDDTYYSLRDLSPFAKGKPAKQSEATNLSRQLLASDRFIDESTTVLDGGNRSVSLAIDGLTCAACGWLVEQVATAQTGMHEASVNLPDSSLQLEFDPQTASLPHLLDALGRFGYELHPRKARADGASRVEKKLLTKVGVCWALAGNVMLLSFALYAGLTLDNDVALATAARWASFVLATIAVVFGGSVFFRTAAASIRMAWRNRTFVRLHIDTPISLGILGGYFNSGWATLTGRGEIWFDSITVLIAALLTARWLQVRSQRSATQAATRLLDLVPTTVRRLKTPDRNDKQGDHHLDEIGHNEVDEEDGDEVNHINNEEVEYIDAESIRVGDRVQVNPGEVVPVDGHVLTGYSSLNNAVITGESAPVRVGRGQQVFAGSVNQSSPLVIRVDQSGGATRVGKLLEWLERSRNTQAPVVQLTDRIAGIFVAVIILAAIGTAAGGALFFPDTAVNRVVALLVISCPCALGMATPLAIASANGRAARRGIYVKDGSIVEVLTHAEVVVFDKTGTLTEGDLSVVQFAGEAEALEAAAALEQYSDHPIAKAIVAAAQEADAITREHVVDQIEAISGLGILGHVNRIPVVVGKPEWIAQSAAFDSVQRNDVEAYARSGLTPVCVAMDGVVVGVIGCGDRIRPQARQEITRLRDRGLRVLLLSGDHEQVVQSVARQVGIASTDAFGGVGPEAKQAFIADLERSRRVVMVGDGTNDAAALETASVGIAVGNSNAPSLVASDIFVPAERATHIGEILEFSDRVLRLIKRNLGVSLAYNLLAGVAAILGFVTPLVAAVAMPLSSLFVVTTSVTSDPFRSSAAMPESPSGGATQPGATAGSSNTSGGLIRDSRPASVTDIQPVAEVQE